ncbi:alpha/beta hydrolase family protein [Phaeacidiphilus oryzae]|uniref:alpha/beta hydrolase family protein n=1 Tax=Phaeacidiphilus oryzae TaxID=348818 RepID=UPI000568C70B|nr:acetylhydrolase [Phaeacidiphilus oryzae]
MSIRRTAPAAALAAVLSATVLSASVLATSGDATAAPRPAASAVVGAAAGTAATARAASTELALPRPTGPYAVGESTLEMVDVHRRDPWVPSAGPRRLMVSVLYPARPGGGPPAPYLTTAEARLFLAAQAPGSAFPAQALADARTYARLGARPAPGRFPLVLLSPGFELPRATLTGLAVDLASRGYVVALVGHTYEDSGTTFPDGTTVGCAICDDASADPAAIARSRALDLSFVLDELTGPRPVWPYARLIDRRRVGVAGHSLGGDAAMAAMAGDARFRAGIDLDGAFFDQVPASGLGGRPFLLLGNPADHGVNGGEPSWSTAWPRLDGWKRWITVTGTDHVSFTDIPVLADEAGIPGVDGTISSPRAEQLTRECVAAFFTLHLKAVPQPLLDGPTPTTPELVFDQPPR